MKVVAALVVALAVGCKEDAPSPPADPCVEAGQLYVIHAREVGQRAFASIQDPNERSDREEDLEAELRAAQRKFPAACAAIGGETLRRCLRLLRSASKDAADRSTLANDAQCSAAGDRLYEELYGAAPPP